MINVSSRIRVILTAAILLNLCGCHWWFEKKKTLPPQASAPPPAAADNGNAASGGQSSTSNTPIAEVPGTLSALYSAVQAQEANFPLPQTEATIQVADIDVSESSIDEPVINYKTPTYTDNSTHPINFRGPAPCETPSGPGRSPRFLPVSAAASAETQHTTQSGTGPCIIPGRRLNYGGALTVTNISRLNIVFTISNWRNLPIGTTLSLTIAYGGQQQTVPFGTAQIEFTDVKQQDLPLSVVLHGGGLVNSSPADVPVSGVLPFKISWSTVGAGAMTLPVIPVAIVYAPPVDMQKKNQSSAAVSSTVGNTTTVSLTTQNSNTTPVPSTFQSVTDMSRDMSALSTVLANIPNPTAKGVGTALKVIASGLGTSTATQTTATSITQQQSLAFNTSQMVTNTAFSSEGGPGKGDIIDYYYNARVVWYANNGAMRLALLGFDGFAQPTAGQLASALTSLQGQPAGTIDPVWHINAESIKNLLKIDPFVSGGSGAALDSNRFVAPDCGPFSARPITVGGGTVNLTCSHTVTAADAKQQQTITSTVQIDNPGFLSVLGLGVTQAQTLQSSITQGSSSQVSSSQTFTESFTLNGNGNESYTTEVYFDVVYGVFAFRQISSGSH